MRIKKIILLLLTILISTFRISYADYNVTTEPFDAWPKPASTAGKENFQHDQFTGSAKYSIPLEVAPGTNGMQPELVLRYLSGAGNSSAGQGWTIDLGVITRSTRLAKPNFNDSDLFVLQLNDLGSELTNIGGGQFRTKIESNLRITKSGSSWLIEDRDGTRYEYNFQLGDLNFYLTRITDTYGNYVDITYTSSDFVGYIDRITYTQGNGLTQFRTIDFAYETRTDDFLDISTGRAVKYTKRVDFVDIKIDGSLYKRYDFTYTYALNSKRSLLTQVNEIGKDGTSFLMVAQFSYLNNSISFNPSTLPIPNPPPSEFDLVDDPRVRIGDVNGDGYPDLFRLQSGTVTVSLGQSQGWGTVLNSSFSHFGFDSIGTNLRLADVNGDGKDEIIKSTNSSNFGGADYYIAFNNGSSFGNGYGWDTPVFISNTGSWARTYSLFFQTTQLANVNGDKYIDLVSARQLNQNDTTVTYYVAYGNGSGWNDWVATTITLPVNFLLGPFVYTVVGVHSTANSTILTDINGDGLEDIVSSQNRTYPTPDFHFYYILNNGTSWDGVIREAKVSTPEFFDLRFASTQIFDVNRDGFPDLLSGRRFNPGNIIIYKYLLGKGNGFGSEQTLSSFPPWSTGDRGVLITDVNRDGVADILNTENGQFSPSTLNFPHDELLKEITTRFGGKITFTYKSPIQAGNTTFPFSLAVLASTTFDPGVSFAAPAGTYNYIYNGGLYDLQNKLFRGFQHVQTTDPLSFVHNTYFHQIDSKLGKVDHQDNAIKSIVNIYQEDGSAPYFTPLIQSDECTQGKCGRTTFEYDEHSNVTKAVHHGDISVIGDEKTIVTEYTKNTSLWIVNTPRRETFFANTDGSGLSLAESQYFYDNNANFTDMPIKGDLTKVRRYLDTENDYIQTLFAYDSFGNETSRTDPNGNPPTTTIYDSTYHTFPVTITNPKGHVETASFYMPLETNGLFGQLKSTTDSNNSTTSFEYDVFGRRTKVIGPNDLGSTYGSESYEYGINGPGANYILTRITEQNGTSNHLAKIDILDGFGKNIQTAREGENAGDYSYVSTNYNQRDEAAKLSLPYYKSGGLSTSYQVPDGAIRWREFTYDAIGRVTRVTNPDAFFVNYGFSGWTTTITDENNHPKMVIRDFYNRIIQVIEPSTFTTQYQYDIFDRLKQITDHASHVWSYSYDSLGRKISETDPDLGLATFDEYDDNGNLLEKTDALGRKIVYQYDELNRLISKDYSTGPGVEYLYFYDEPASSFGIGRRSRMTDLSGETKFDYDNEGRVISKEVSVTGVSGSFVLQWIYDALDRAKKITYPNGKEVDFTYNPQGLVETISDFVTDIDYVAQDREDGVTFLNGQVVDYSYRTDNQRLNRIQTGSLMDFNYQYDPVGNMTQVRDDAKAWVKDYTYDDLDRLLTGDGETFSYNAIGNIITRNGTPQLYGGLQPHALTNDGGNSYAYDLVGNMMNGAGRTISYDAENRPIQVLRNGVTTEFFYNGDGDKVLKTVNGGAFVQKTVYIDDLYEKKL